MIGRDGDVRTVLLGPFVSGKSSVALGLFLEAIESDVQVISRNRSISVLLENWHGEKWPADTLPDEPPRYAFSIESEKLPRSETTVHLTEAAGEIFEEVVDTLCHDRDHIAETEPTSTLSGSITDVARVARDADLILTTVDTLHFHDDASYPVQANPPDLDTVLLPYERLFRESPTTVVPVLTRPEPILNVAGSTDVGPELESAAREFHPQLDSLLDLTDEPLYPVQLPHTTEMRPDPEGEFCGFDHLLERLLAEYRKES